jgi:hypothetical protein
MDELRNLANKRKGTFWPAAAPFDNCDVVVSFRTPEDAEAFSRCLAFGEPGTQTFDFAALARIRKIGTGSDC